MMRHKQAFLHDPQNGVWGDCFRTAVACVLEVAREEVPHVFHDGCDGQTADARMNEWLAQRGLVQIVLAYSGADMTVEQVLAPINCTMPETAPEYLLYGRSRNGTDHVVVCKGNKIAWDPSKDESGIVGPCTDGYWWLVFLAALHPKAACQCAKVKEIA